MNRAYFLQHLRSAQWCLGLLAWGLSSSLLAQEIVVESVLLSTIHSANIPARDVGILEQMLVKEGDAVEKGAPVARLDQEEARLSQELSLQELNTAKLEEKNHLREEYAVKAAKVAKAELKRSLDANKKFPESVSQTEIDRLELLAQKADLDVRLAKHEQKIISMNTSLKQLQFNISEHKLNRLTIFSPVSGTVVELNRKAGEWVEPGDVLVRIINTAQLRGEAVLPKEYRNLPLKGRIVQVHHPDQADDQATVKGHVTFIRPEIDPIDGSFRIWMEFNNSNKVLRPGDSVTITISPGRD